MDERKTKFCCFCGKEISINAKKCKYCGRWLNDTNDNVKHLNIPQKEEEVVQNKTETKKQCPFCCQMIPSNARKCQYCGEWISETDNPQELCPGFFVFQSFAYAIFILLTIGFSLGINLFSGLLIGLCCFITYWLYFIPTYVALYREHRKTTAIFIINLILGETFIGWVVALVWALSGDRYPSKLK